MKTHTVMCNKCGHKMRYQPTKTLSKASKKRCVYCGHNITVVDQILT